MINRLCLFFSIFLILALFTTSAISKTIEKNIKIAILDNFHFQPQINDNYNDYYLSGINLAKSYFKKQGYIIDYKVFNYGQSPLDILNAIPHVLSWNPDVVIGPRNSNMFLMTKGHFKDILVISPFATSSTVSNMPDNYYSLTFPVKYTAIGTINFLKKKYPDKKVFTIVEADCKNCMDVASAFYEEYQKNKFEKGLYPREYLQDEANTLNLKNLLSGYKKGDLIFLPNTSYSSAVLIMRITNYLKSKVTFIGSDGWGDWNNTEIGKLNGQYPYEAYRITPWSLDIKNKDTKRFIKIYKDNYRKPPLDSAAYLSFRTIDSIVSAINIYGKNYGNMKEIILFSYKKALEKNKGWFRPREYAIYKLTFGKEVFFDNVSINEN